MINDSLFVFHRCCLPLTLSSFCYQILDARSHLNDCTRVEFKITFPMSSNDDLSANNSHLILKNLHEIEFPSRLK
jgi:hypothetical protein